MDGLAAAMRCSAEQPFVQFPSAQQSFGSFPALAIELQGTNMKFCNRGAGKVLEV